MSHEKRRPPSLIRDPALEREPIPGPDQRTVVLRMSSGAPYVIAVDQATAREVVENLSDYWDGVPSGAGLRVIDAEGRGFMLNPAHVVAVDVR
jgi:hypothetical protein